MTDTVPDWIRGAEEKADADLKDWTADDDVSEDTPLPDWADDGDSPSTDDEE